MPKFHEDAIVLSGITGTKLKCEILGEYYPLWWKITSGGEKKNFQNNTSIIELNAGTGEDYIEETGETILGSSGHALELKMNQKNTSNLKIVLVEEDKECYSHLEQVIRKRWPNLDIKNSMSIEGNSTGVYLFNKSLEHVLESLDKIDLGYSIFFFDPLFYTKWSIIEKVARNRIKQYYQKGTEFIVFLFTSDWFTGRKSLNVSPLPTNNQQTNWSEDERKTVSELYELLGTDEWRSELLTSECNDAKMERLTKIYKQRLNKWFRYVLPLPFVPKRGQMYHLFMCSNYEDGVNITLRFYANFTKNPQYKPDNKTAYQKFAEMHPDLVVSRRKRPTEWKFLWNIIKNHLDGLCDSECYDLIKLEKDMEERKKILGWLCSKNYLKQIERRTDVWQKAPDNYQINWDYVTSTLGIPLPPKLKPLSEEDLMVVKHQ